MFPVLLLGITGFFGFGASVHYQTHWIGPVLTFGLANMAMAFANGCVFGYVIDSYEDLSEEGLKISSHLVWNFLTLCSLCRNQCSEFAHIRLDLFRQRLASKGWRSCGFQCSRELFHCSLHVDTSTLDLWQAHTERHCSQPSLE